MSVRLFLFKILSLISEIFKPAWIKVGGKSFLYSCKYKSSGGGNFVYISDCCSLTRCTFQIKGNNNIVKIASNCKLSGVSFWISGNNNIIEIGNHTTVGKGTQFAALEGTSIKVGTDCMFSHDIKVRTSDSHSLVDLSGKRINPAKNIIIGNHCWIGMQSLILKGSKLSGNTILAARSILNKQYEDSNCIIGGSPAKVIKTGVNWDREKL